MLINFISLTLTENTNTKTFKSGTDKPPLNCLKCNKPKNITDKGDDTMLEKLFTMSYYYDDTAMMCLVLCVLILTFIDLNNGDRK